MDSSSIPEDDIFISYAHIDNEPLAPGQPGWVTNFHLALETRFRQRFGKAPKIWRDNGQLQGNHYFEEVLRAKLPKIAVLICILSERYLESKWCQDERQLFCQVAEQNGGLTFANKARIFKVEKTLVPPDKHPAELCGLLGYRFYYLDPEKKRPREFNTALGSGTYVDYQNKLDDLIDDINQLLTVLHAQAEQVARPAPVQLLTVAPTGATVYLAETTYDLQDERDKIKRELQRRGHVVLPDKQLPLYAPEFEQCVRAELRRCQLSLHLVGENYGLIPEAGRQSAVSWQNDLAAEHSRQEPSFLRLIWLPPGLQVEAVADERQQQFIKHLRYNPAAQYGAELLQTTLEEFKSHVQDKLKPKPKPPEPSLSHEPGHPYIYLICDQQDVGAVTPLENFLYEAGYDVFLPAFEADEAQVREDHKETLLLCDAILIYYGNVGEFWLRAKLRDLQKIAGYGRTKPMLAKAIYIATPDSAHKQRFRLHEATLIRNYEPFAPTTLDPFLTQLGNDRSVKGGRR